FLFGLAWFFLSRAFGEERLPGWRGMPVAYYRDAFVLALGGSGLLAGLGCLPYLVARVWPTTSKELPASLPGGLDFYLPGAHAIAGSVLGGLLSIGVWGLAGASLGCFARRGGWGGGGSLAPRSAQF